MLYILADLQRESDIRPPPHHGSLDHEGLPLQLDQANLVEKPFLGLATYGVAHPSRASLQSTPPPRGRETTDWNTEAKMGWEGGGF